MINLKSFIIFSCLLTFVSCVPTKAPAPAIGLGNVASSASVGPVVTSQDLEITHGNYVGEIWAVEEGLYLTVLVTNTEGLKKWDNIVIMSPTGTTVQMPVYSLRNTTSDAEVDIIAFQGLARIPYVSGMPIKSRLFTSLDYIDLAGSSTDSTLIYTITGQPSHGYLLGTPPSVVYIPDPVFVGYDRFYFTATDAQGKYARGSVSIKVEAKSTVIYLRTSGNDATGEPGKSTYPYLTAQAAVDAAIAFNPSITSKIVINVGTGNFGSVTLTEGFGKYVSWVGVGLGSSIIGDFVGWGADGGVDENGSHGFSIIIDSDFNITFGDVTSRGGNAGLASTKITYGGRPGEISFKGIGGNIYSIPGSGMLLDLSSVGVNAGSVIIEADSIVNLVTADGIVADSASSGGSVTVTGRVLGSVSAVGGANSGGKGGSVTVTGQVDGTVYAYGGLGNNGGDGGLIHVTGTVVGNLEAYGGIAVTGYAGNGGALNLENGGYVGDIYAYGGNGAVGGGDGGIISINLATAGDIYVSGGTSASVLAYDANLLNAAGQGGIVSIFAYSISGILTAPGGNCHSGNAGDGGTINYHSTATFTLGSVAGGTCIPGIHVGADGSADSL